MNDDTEDTSQTGFWREWGSVAACAILTGAGLYLLILSSAPLASILLLAVAFMCPLAAGIVWWWAQHHRT